jgi:hypothetical protein
LGWKPIILAYHNRELVVPANQMTKMSKSYTKEFSNMKPPMKLDFSQQGASSSSIQPERADGISQPRVTE